MVTVTKEMVQQIPCPKCAAKAGKSCGHRKDKSRSHHKRLEAAQKHFNTGAKSMAEYDNTNSGAAFKPFDTMRMILQGKMNIEGNDRKVVLVADETKNGKRLVEVYQKVAVLFEEDKGDNPSRPDYAGPVEDYATNKNMRMAGWKRSKDGKNFMSLQISEKTGKQGGEIPFNDNIPF